MSHHENKKRKERNFWPLWVIGGGLFVALIFFSMRHTSLDAKNQVLQKESTFHESFPGLEAAASLDEAQRSWVVQTANAEPCACKCGHKLAHCLVADETCPLKEKNRTRVAEIISQAHAIQKGDAKS